MSIKLRRFIGVSVLLTLTIVGLLWHWHTPPTAMMTVNRADFGVDVFSYDQQLSGSGAIRALKKLDIGLQQFPNANTWSWVSNQFHPGDGPAPVSLAKWGHILSSTGSQGLFIFNYDENSTWTGGGNPSDAIALANYIRQKDLPISAIVIGSEEYGSWDFPANLNPEKTATYYGQRADAIARAIHQTDPQLKVGICFNPGERTGDRAWNQTVLRLTADDIDFVSVHDYPIPQSISNADLLQQLPKYITLEMTYVKNEITENIPPARAQHVQVWVTEFDPYGEPGVQSTQPVYGAALVESLITWRALGATRVVIWSFDGGAHVTGPGWPMASSEDTQYGLFALVGDGNAPEIAANSLYPSGQAVADFMQAIGSGGELSTWIGEGLVVGQVARRGSTQAFLINETSDIQRVEINGDSVSIPPATSVRRALPAPIRHVAPFTTASYVAKPPRVCSYTTIPGINAPPTKIYPGESVTLHGSDLGTSSGYVVLTQGNIEYGAPEDAYKVTIQSWTPLAMTFRVPDGSSGPRLQPGRGVSLRLVTADKLLSATQSIMVTASTEGILHAKP